MIASFVLAFALVSAIVDADYECVCNFAVEKKVYPSPNDKDNPIGYLYEFDCKSTVPVTGLSSQYKGIAYEHKLGYVELDQNTEMQLCQGDPSSSDTVYSTTTTKTATSMTTAHPSPKATTRVSNTRPALTTSPMKHTTAVPSTTTSTNARSTTISTTKGSTTVTTNISESTTSTEPSTLGMTTSESTTAMSTTIATTRGLTTTNTSQSTTPPMHGTSTEPSTVGTTTSGSTTAMSATTSTTRGSTITSISQSTTQPIHDTSTIPSTALTRELTTPSTHQPTTASTPTTILTTALPKPVSSTKTTDQTTINLHNVYITGSPLAYIGIGYNLLTGNPSGLDRSNGGGDPGMLVNRRFFQLTPKTNGSDVEATEAEVTSLKNCDYSTARYLIHDGSSYQKELRQFVALQNDGDANLATVSNAFTLNQDFMQVKRRTEGGDHTVYNDVISSCILGTARYKEELANVSNFMVSRQFARDVCQLPLTYNASVYSNFVDKWGTNIVMAVNTGTLSVKRYRTTGQQVLSHLNAQGATIFYPTGHYGSYPTSVTINSTELSKTTMTPFGAVIDTHQLGTRSLPVPVQITLSPISSALDIKYWSQIINHRQFSDVCSNFDEASLSNIHTNIKTAVQRHTAYKTAGNKPLHDIPITIPMTWPYGTYGLMKAASGCPGSNVPWQSGYRKYDTEDSDSHNYFSSNIQNYLSGRFQSDDIITYFCMKTQASTDTVHNRAWPSGSYCILKKGTCPSGFSSGHLHWDDDDIFNHNAKGGTLPDGHYSSNTDIYYCCRNDGLSSNAILLPRDQNFILLRYKGQCQLVFGMTVQEVLVRWDDEDLLNRDSASGAHPFDDGGSKDHKLHFCYYAPRQTVQPGIIG